jgi:Tol biopolymer transport system component
MPRQLVKGEIGVGIQHISGEQMNGLKMTNIGLFVGASMFLMSPSISSQVENQGVRELILDGRAPLAALAPAFSPDGKLVVFGQEVGNGDTNTILISQKANGHWTPAKVAPFSGTYRDLEPTFDPRGKYIIFASNRPLAPNGSIANGNYGGKQFPGKGGHLWRVERRGLEWGIPAPLPAIINASDSTFSPSVTGDGSLYFMRPVNAGETFHLYRAQMKGRQYLPPVRVEFSNLDGVGDYDPAVAKDESFVVFSSSRSGISNQHADLFIVYRRSEKWSEPADLQKVLSPEVYGIEARLSPDNKTLFFTNSRSAGDSTPEQAKAKHTWQVALARSEPANRLVK